MSEENTIPAEMLEAAAEAMLFHPHDGNYSRLAEAALRAAGVPELAARIAELEAALSLAIPRMEHLQSLLSCGESVQFCNEFDEQESKEVAEEIERLKRIMQNAPMSQFLATTCKEDFLRKQNRQEAHCAGNAARDWKLILR